MGSEDLQTESESIRRAFAERSVFAREGNWRLEACVYGQAHGRITETVT